MKTITTSQGRRWTITSNLHTTRATINKAFYLWARRWWTTIMSRRHKLSTHRRLRLDWWLIMKIMRLSCHRRVAHRLLRTKMIKAAIILLGVCHCYMWGIYRCQRKILSGKGPGRRQFPTFSRWRARLLTTWITHMGICMGRNSETVYRKSSDNSARRVSSWWAKNNYKNSTSATTTKSFARWKRQYANNKSNTTH